MDKSAHATDLTSLARFEKFHATHIVWRDAPVRPYLHYLTGRPRRLHHRAALGDLAKQLQLGQPNQAIEKDARKLQTDAQKEILDTLTSRQQKAWVGLLGERVDLANLGRVKFKAPDIHGREDWINSSPLGAEQFKGQVVALYFYAYG